MAFYDLYQDYTLMNNGSNCTYCDYNFGYDELVEPILKWFEAVFVVPVGVLGNIFVLCVLLQKKYHNSSTAVFFSALAVSDISILVTGIYNLLTFRFSAGLDCVIVTYFWLSSGQVSSCILATVASERAFNVMYPHRAKMTFTAGNAKVTVSTITIMVLGLNTALIVTYNEVEENFFKEMYCPTMETLQSSIIHVYPLVDFCLGFAIPFVIIVLCSITIIMRLKRATQKRKNNKMSSLTKTLLSTNVCFLVTLAPIRIFNIIHPVPVIDELGFHIFLVFSTLSQVNAAANFFLYFLNAPVFRADIRRLLCWQSNSDKVTRATATENLNQRGTTRNIKF